MSLNKTKYFSFAEALLSLMLLWGCVKDQNFDTPKATCEEVPIANTTFAQVKSLFQGSVVQIQEDLIIEGFVISSDSAGNFFNTLHFQDKATNPTEGFQIDIDLRSSYLFHPVGQKVIIKLKGLYLGRTRGVFKVGGVFTAFGNLSVGRLPANVISKHLFASCEEIASIEPTEVVISGLQDSMINTLVQFNGVEIVEEQLGELFAVLREETGRTLVDCNESRIILLNSGYADFQGELLPEANGIITGVLLKDNTNFQLVIRDVDDINFTEERCAEIIDEFTSENFFISELADPDNNAGARFVELYNSALEPLSLKGWRLNRYTNASTTISSSINLSNFTVGPESTFVISPNASVFESVYGFPPDLGVSTNSPADSNGDDNLELVDPFGTVIDMFGVIGVDGSGTNHEFEDGRAFRRMEITKGNPVYTFSEWIIYNDTGGAGTTNQPQNAPEDFSLGDRGF